MLKSCALVFLFLIAHAACDGEAQPQSLGGAVIKYSLPTHRLVLHEPVVLEFSVKNETNTRVVLNLGQDRKGGYEFSVTPPGGEKLRLRRYAHAGIARVGRLSIEPGLIFSQRLILNEWYDFATPGRYDLEGRLVEPIEGTAYEERDPGFHGVIEVGPEDVRKLKVICDSLAKKVVESRTYEDAAQAALALSYVKDPVAVPYLERILAANKSIQLIAVQGLERVGDDNAIRALGSALGLPGDASILARAALQRLASETADAARKETIKEILTQTPTTR
jgi:hypothetical protein